MNYILRYAGFWALAVLAQWIFLKANIDILEDINIFRFPPITFYLGVASILWLILDFFQNRFLRLIARISAFWIPEVALLTVAFLFPYRLIASDGLGIGIAQFLFTYWIANIGVYWFVVELVKRLIKQRKRSSEQAA